MNIEATFVSTAPLRSGAIEMLKYNTVISYDSESITVFIDFGRLSGHGFLLPRARLVGNNVYSTPTSAFDMLLMCIAAVKTAVPTKLGDFRPIREFHLVFILSGLCTLPI